MRETGNSWCHSGNDWRQITLAEIETETCLVVDKDYHASLPEHMCIPPNKT